MRLSLVLFRRNRLPNGHIHRGKDRLIKRVEPVHLRKLQEDFAIEEKNMLYLRHPYLTEVCFINSVICPQDDLVNKRLGYGLTIYSV